MSENKSEQQASKPTRISTKQAETESQPQKKRFVGKQALAFGAVIISFIVGGTIGIAGGVVNNGHSHHTKTQVQSSKSNDSKKSKSEKQQSSSSVTTDNKNSSSSNSSSSSSSSDSNAELVAETNQLPRASDYYIGQHVTVRIYGKQEMAVIQAITNDTLVIRYDNANYTVNFDRSVKQ